ncbi:MAG: hypothetical protein P0Y65_12490 [Candidatus Devosia phytovorans]|uniref:Uncharacterized protein n=1 Tax=Candidatus Devosia phytovorans TaxID=3121372 RepID=A0AAJ6B009_9HYPH|nr:hypothetical protein [Devosia sp.]WEK03023.1 MAG: hypothetical protein P0Y65_12490 [Devosia sp.]
MTLGAFSAMTIAAIGPGVVIETFADEAPTVGIDPSKLVRYEGRKYIVDYDASVSTDPISTSQVKKIEGGRVSYVTITTTETGTYSSDAMFSNHVQYPGIDVQPVHSRNHFAYWTNGHWSGFVTRAANSFIYARSWRN